MAADLSLETTENIGEINKYNFRTESKAVFKARKGLDREIVGQISEIKGEPEWMRDFRLKSLDIFNSKPMPNWGGDIHIDFGHLLLLKAVGRPRAILGRCTSRNQRHF